LHRLVQPKLIMFGTITAQKLSENDDGNCVVAKLSHLNADARVMVLRQAVQFGVTICDNCLRLMNLKSIPRCSGLNDNTQQQE